MVKTCSINARSYYALMATVVNRTYHSRNGELLEITSTFRGVFRNLSGGLNFFFHFRGGSAPLWDMKTPWNQKISLVQGGLAPIAPPWIRLCLQYLQLFHVNSKTVFPVGKCPNCSKLLCSPTLLKKHLAVCKVRIFNLSEN